MSMSKKDTFEHNVVVAVAYRMARKAVDARHPVDRELWESALRQVVVLKLYRVGDPWGLARLESGAMLERIRREQSKRRAAFEDVLSNADVLRSILAQADTRSAVNFSEMSKMVRECVKGARPALKLTLHKDSLCRAWKGCTQWTIVSLAFDKVTKSQTKIFVHLESFTDLKELNLSGTHVKHLTPLKGLTNLKILDLTRTKVTDLLPLKRLVALEALNLTRTEVTDLLPLAGLVALEELNLFHTQVTDLAPLEGLTYLNVVGHGLQ